jgi:RHH-type proline utilization regulon transcriptional repressor/proline dehydrogenase/delta 1-pyrroline-5-carboxylate dehydrogenase
VFGDPRDVETHIGPVIDREARDRLEAHIAGLRGQARLHYCGKAPSHGFYVPPCIFELVDARQLATEVFGPILHVVRYQRQEMPDLLDAINSTGYGLTFGIHTRIDGLAEAVADRLAIGNVYVNRNMIGAVVGVQPFGGRVFLEPDRRPVGRTILFALPPSKRLRSILRQRAATPA